MEEKKFDINSIIGFILIGGILFWMMYNNKPTPEELEAEKVKTEQAEADAKKESEEANKEETVTLTEATEELNSVNSQDSLGMQKMQNKLGSFAYSSTLPSATEASTVIENDVLSLTISNKGGYISEARLKQHTTYDSIPIYLIRNGNSSMNFQFSADNRLLNTKDLFFEPTLSSNGENTVLSMKLKTSPSTYIEYRYEISPDDYMIDFSIKSQGLENVITTSQPMYLEWDLKGFRHSKSIVYENRYTRLTYEHEGDKYDKLAQASEDEEIAKNVGWMNYRQHFFSSILITNTPFKEVTLISEDLVKDAEIDTVYTKRFNSKITLEAANGGGISYDMSMYYGPTDYKVLNSYDKNLGESVYTGWGIFGMINRLFVTPLFGFLSGFLPAGIAIIFLTVLIKLLLSPVQYKQYLSQAKLKVLKPELDEIKKKFEGNKMKIQQETMKLQNIAGASPLKGCLPALLQIPVFYALFTFFPSAFSLRQKSFLWADDLSSFDTIAEIPYIPLYGDHISLFPILASIAIFIYMMMTTGQTMQQNQQPGMPNMKFIMYLSPLMMLVFFNNYASGLSLYYLVSNLITIGIMLVIKKFIIDDKKILAKIEVNKKKPKKQNRFQRKMSDMMEQAEEQKKKNKR